MAIRSSEQLVVVDHPLAQHKLALIRDRTTTTRDFRWLMGELAAFLCYEATRDRLSKALYEVTESVCRDDWDGEQIRALLRRVSSAMSDEVDHLAARQARPLDHV